MEDDDNKPTKVGARTKLTPENRAAILQVLASGCTNRDAYESVGVGKTTYFNWLNKNKEFYAEVQQAKAQSRVMVTNMLVEQIKKGSAAAAIFWLKNRAPEEWSDNPSGFNGANISVTFNVPRPQHVVDGVTIPRPRALAQKEEDQDGSL